MGKHSKKSEGLNIKKIIMLFILVIIIIGVIVGIIYINKRETLDITSTENGPIISYHDEKNKLKIKIEDNSIINKKVAISYNKGTAIISKDDKKYTKYEGETLTDGRYTIKVTAEDKTATVISFVIDTTPPAVEGIIHGAWYDTAQTITLNIDDIKILTIKRNDKEIASKENFNANGKVTYQLVEDGTYKIYVEDYNGNGMENIVDIWKE